MDLLIAAVEETCAGNEKAAYLALGIHDASYFGKVKRRDKPAPRVTQLTNLPEDTQRDYCKRWGRQLGMRVTDEDARRAALVDAQYAIANALREIG